eukprot:g28245.t1
MSTSAVVGSDVTYSCDQWHLADLVMVSHGFRYDAVMDRVLGTRCLRDGVKSRPCWRNLVRILSPREKIEFYRRRLHSFQISVY